MIKRFKGVAVPSGVDRNLEEVHALMSERVEGCIFNATSRCHIVGLVGCSDIACSNCICAHMHRDLLKEYINKTKSEKENSAMEEQIKAILKPGMVIRTVGGQFFLWIGGVSRECYRIELTPTGVCIRENIAWFRRYGEVDRVFADTHESSPAMPLIAMILSMNGMDASTWVEWKRPEPAKEMTVDEISKALGYKVKVVGNDKADD